MNRKTKDISPVEYAKWQGKTVQNVRKHLKEENWKHLPYIISVKNFSRFYLLEVPYALNAESFSREKIKYLKKKRKP